MAKTLTFLQWVLLYLDRKYPLRMPKQTIVMVSAARDLSKAS